MVGALVELLEARDEGGQAGELRWIRGTLLFLSAVQPAGNWYLMWREVLVHDQSWRNLAVKAVRILVGDSSSPSGL